MTEKRFTMKYENDLLEISTITDTSINGELSAEEICDLLNQINDENKRLKQQNRVLEFRLIDMLDYIKKKGTVTHEEMKKWWNLMIINDE